MLNLVRNAIEAIAAARLAQGCIRIVARTARRALARRDWNHRTTVPESTRSSPIAYSHPSRHRKTKDSVLGLPICVSIIESHGGRLWLQSRACRRNRTPIFAAARSIASVMTMAVPTIFVIDDQEPVRHALGEMLSVFGFATETYELADSFLQAIDKPRPGCVVADVRMPGHRRHRARARTRSSKGCSSGHPHFRSRRCADGGGGDQVRRGRFHREADRRHATRRGDQPRARSHLRAAGCPESRARRSRSDLRDWRLDRSKSSISSWKGFTSHAIAAKLEHQRADSRKLSR